MSKAGIADLYPLSPAQQAMLLYQVASGERAKFYFDQCVLTVRGLDPAAFERAWQRLVVRHAALRTFFAWESGEQPMQAVRKEVVLPWRQLDLGELGEEARASAFEALLQEDHALGFDPAKAPLLRLTLVRWDEKLWKVVWSFSHLILDGWSMALLLAELQTVYAAELAGLEPSLPAARPYRDFIGWLRRQDPEKARAYWQRLLAGFEPPTPLPFDGTGGGDAATDRSWATVEVERLVDLETWARVTAFCRSHQITPATLFQGLWALVVARSTGRRDVVFANIVSGRPYELDGLDSTVGLFINALPTRVRVEPSRPLAAWLEALQAQQFEQRDFEHCTNDQIRDWAGLPRGVPIFETVVVFENYPVQASQEALTALGVERVDLMESSHLPLTLFVAPTRTCTKVRLNYRWERLSEAGAERIVGGLFELLRQALAHPHAPLGSFDPLTAAEHAALVGVGHGPAVPAPAEMVVRRVEAQAVARPAATAVLAGGVALSYAELVERADRLAQHLLELGVGSEGIVGVALERTPDLVIALLAIHKAGGAYLPLDPAYPEERLAWMLEDSGARWVLTLGALRSKLPLSGRTVVCLDHDWAHCAGPAQPIARPLAPAQLAYVIYTSGSTGRPKGVAVAQEALAGYVDTAARAFELEASDRVLQLTSISFDTSLEEILPTLAAGATLVLREEAMVASLATFAERAEELGLTLVDLPTAFWHEWVAALEEAEAAGRPLPWPRALRLVIVGGEAVQGDRLAAWRRLTGDRVRVLNTYGPTEATIVSTFRELGVGAPTFAGEPPIGRPIPGSRVYVVDPDLRLLDHGLEGELAIGGAGLARGYLGRPALTAERFVPDPFSGEPGARLYRSGDLGRWQEGGAAPELAFRGRADGQVKVRGHRIELGEVEAALRALPGVREAVALVVPSEAGVALLAAWVVPGEGAVLSSAALRAELGRRLPEPMVPTALMLEEALPLTPGGKVDRRALAQRGVAGALGELARTPPATPLEEVLAGLWQELLGRPDIAREDDFFALGGHSLLIARLASRLRNQLKIELPLRAIFDHPTVQGLAAELERASQDEALPPPPPLVRAAGHEPAPLSFAQQRLWLLDQIEPGSSAYNLSGALRLSGELVVAAFAGALGEVVRRHEALRTTFELVGDEPRQRVASAGRVPLPVIDLTALPPAAREPVALTLATRRGQQPFDLARGPLFVTTLLRLAPAEHVLVTVVHHAVADGWSMGVLVRELSALYRALVSAGPAARPDGVLPELAIQYRDFALWQRQWLRGSVLEHQLAFWRTLFVGAPPVLELPFDRPRPARRSYQGGRVSARLPEGLEARLAALGRKLSATPFMLHLAAFALLLGRLAGQAKVVVGTPTADRAHPALEGLIGFLTNTLALPVEVGGNPKASELVARVRDLALAAFAHRDLPFERVVDEVNPERDPSHAPLAQVMLAVQNQPFEGLDLPGLRLEPVAVEANRAPHELTLNVFPARAGATGLLVLEHSTDVLDAATAERWLGWYGRALEAVVAAPTARIETLPLLTAEERAALLVEGNRTAREVVEEPVFARIAAQAARRGGEVAIACGGETLTWAELEAQSTSLARELVAHGVGLESRVGVCLERTPFLIVALLAVQKAGGAYVPLDPSYPADRLAWIVEDSRMGWVLAEAATREAVPASSAVVVVREQLGSRRDAGAPRQESFPPGSAGVAPALPTVAGDNLAYVIYTSGSTGRPKGVAVRHRAVSNFVASMERAPGVTDRDRVLALTTVAFDISVLEIFLPLAVGATVELVDRATASDGLALLARLTASPVTVMQATPATWRMLLEAGWAGDPRLKALSGGEALPRDVAEALLARTAELWNVYGPTETTVWSSVERLRPEDLEAGRPVPVGPAIGNTEIHLVGPFRHGAEPVLPGAAGELVIGGEGLARGYFGKPGLTAERFVPDPFSGRPGARLYRTGDLVRRAPGSRTYAFVGRVDHQVKVNGFRIELGEIEAVLASVPGVALAAAVVREDVPGVKRLAGYVQLESGAVNEQVLAAARLRLAERLPAYMVPAVLTDLEALPLTPNGKVDRKALVALPASVLPAAACVAPRNPIEAALAGVWAEVLQRESISVEESFFTLGGDSVLVIQVALRSRRLGLDHTPLELFQHRTIAALAALLASRGATPNAPESASVEPQASTTAFAESGLAADELASLLSELGDEEALL